MSEKAEQAKANLKRLLKENPDIAKAYKETIKEMRQPENMKKTVDSICNVMSAVQQIQKECAKKQGD